MNDFTKEELIYLFEAIDSDIEYFNEPDIAYNARDKLKSIINNYCEHEEMVTADMKECQAICTLNENGKTYFTIKGNIYPFHPHAAIDIAHKIICNLVIGENHFSSEWIDKIIARLEE